MTKVSVIACLGVPVFTFAAPPPSTSSLRLPIQSRCDVGAVDSKRSTYVRPVETKNSHQEIRYTGREVLRAAAQAVSLSEDANEDPDWQQ